ncbi:MAG: Smr/MutS family protein [Bacteroidota bacterium]
MDKFQIGDAVEVLDDQANGKVTQIKGDVITVVLEDGFSLEYFASELIKTGNAIEVSNIAAAQAKAHKEIPKKRRQSTPKPKERNAPKMEVDLHIEKLVKQTKDLGHFEMLNIQLDTAKRQLEFAMQKGIQKVVFIHGVGEGVLKEELHFLFRKYERVRFYEAEYRKYGLGATEVYINQG